MGAQIVLTYVFLSIDCVIAVLIVISVLLQGGQIRGIGNAIAGTNDSTLFTNFKANLGKSFSIFLTWRLGIVFIIFTFVITMLIVHHVLLFG